MNLNIVKSLLLITLFIVLVSSLSADCKLMALIGLNGGELSNSNSGAWYYFANPCLDKL